MIQYLKNRFKCTLPALFWSALLPEGISIFICLIFALMVYLINDTNILNGNVFMVFPGFYIFQVIGFFSSIISVYVLLAKNKEVDVVLVSIFFFISASIDLLFFIAISVQLDGIIILLFLHKIIAVSVGIGLYLVYEDEFYSC